MFVKLLFWHDVKLTIIFSGAKYGARIFFSVKKKIFSGFGIFFPKHYKNTRKRLQIDCGEQNE